MKNNNGSGSATFHTFLATIAAMSCSGIAGACDLGAWTVVDTNNRLSAVSDARNTGLCGLQVDLDNTDSAYVIDSTASSLTNASVRVYVFGDAVSLAGPDALTLLAGYDSGSQTVFELQLVAVSGLRKLRLTAYDDAFTAVSNTGQEVDLDDGWRSIELHWRAAGVAGANDGRLAMRLDGILMPSVAQLDALDNDTREWSSTRLGAVVNNTATIGGRIDFDDYSSRELGAAPMLDKFCNASSVSIENMTYRKGDWHCVAGTTFTASRRTRIDPRGLLTVISDAAVFGDGFSVANGGFLRVDNPAPVD